MTTFIKADKFFYPYATKVGGYLTLTTDGKFGKHVESIPEDSQVIDYSGKYIAPGLVDTHVHGYAGADVMDNDKDGIKQLVSTLMKQQGQKFKVFSLKALTLLKNIRAHKMRRICATQASKSSRAGKKRLKVCY